MSDTIIYTYESPDEGDWYDFQVKSVKNDDYFNPEHLYFTASENHWEAHTAGLPREEVRKLRDAITAWLELPPP